MSRGHVRRRGASWEWIAELGDQPCRRCTDCQRRRWGSDHPACPKCGGRLGAVVLERRQRSKAGYPRRRDAQAALTELLRSVDTGGFTAPSDLTVGEYLAEWLPTARIRLRAGAFDAVRMHIEAYIVPRIGGMPLKYLTPTRVRGFYAELRERGGSVEHWRQTGRPPSPESVQLAETIKAAGHRGMTMDELMVVAKRWAGAPSKQTIAKRVQNLRYINRVESVEGSSPRRYRLAPPPVTGREPKPLSAKTVHNVHVTLNRALSDAVDDGVIPKNPAVGASVEPESPEQVVWSAEQLHDFLAYVKDNDARGFPMWRTLAFTGLRRGELVGLRWSDVDLDRRVVSVVQQRAKGDGDVQTGPPKTRRSRRVVDFDAETGRVLKEWRRRQLEQERMPLGPAYDDQGLVFALPTGGGVHPDVVTKRMRRLCREVGLPWVKPHGLRHTHATLLLAAGVHPKVVQERLGHASISVTIDLYSHVMPGMQADAAAAVAALVDGLEATG